MFDLKKLFSSENKVVGLDVGSCFVRLAEIRDNQGEFSLQTFHELPLEKGIVENGLIKDPYALSKTIRELFRQSHCKTKNVVTALPGPLVVIKKAQFKTMDEEELREVILDEAENYMPITDIQQHYFDFHVIGESEANPNQMDVLVAAAKKDIIQSYVEVIERSGLQVVIMDIDSFALETAYEENYDPDYEDVVALIHTGASITTLNILRGGGSVFTRSFLLGGNNLTEAVRQKLELSFEEAEEVKKRGFSEDEFMLREIMEPLMMEIERSIEYFSATVGGMFVDKLIMSGGGAKLPGMGEIISERLRCDLELFNPFRAIRCDGKLFPTALLEEIAPAAAQSVGLALRRIDDK